MNLLFHIEIWEKLIAVMSIRCYNFNRGRQRCKFLHADCESSAKMSKLSPQALILMQACPFPKLALIRIQSVHGFKPARVNANAVFKSVTTVSEHAPILVPHSYDAVGPHLFTCFSIGNRH